MSANNSKELVVVDQRLAAVKFAPQAMEIRRHALAVATMVDQVKSEDDQVCAVDAQRKIREALKTCEDARKAVKEPFLEIGRKIDAAAKEFSIVLKEEEVRIARLLGDYQQEQLEKIRAAERARAEELARIERERLEAERKAQAEAEEKLRAAKDAAEAERIAKALEAEKQRQIELAAQQTEALGKAPEVAKVDGQIVREVTEFEVTDIWALARAHPACVKIEPLRQQIRELLDLGIKVAGIRTWKETKSSVRMTKGKTVDV